MDQQDSRSRYPSRPRPPQNAARGYSQRRPAAYSSGGVRSGGYPPQRRPVRRRRRSPLPYLVVVVLAVVMLVIACVLAFQGDGNADDSSQQAGSAQSNEPSAQSAMGTVASQSAHAASATSTSSDVAIDKTDWRLVLVNATHALDGDYDVELAPVNESYQLDARIVEDMQAMIAAAKEDGYTLYICSAYRSTQRSRELYTNKVNEFKAAGYSDADASVEAAKWVAPPGTSEHNTGLAADIVSGDYFTKFADLEHDFETFPEFEWLYTHCAEYGFILRYPKDKQDITGITYEPWHYRYVGREHAQAIMQQGLCLEEYLGETG